MLRDERRNKVIRKKVDLSLWKEIKYFKKQEFACPCCGECKMEMGFVSWLDEIRSIYGKPIVITSGYRCEKHNFEVGGVPDSAHLKGLAADIRVHSDEERYELVKIMLRHGAFRIGVGRTFIHVDFDVKKPRPRLWVYGNK